MGAEKMQKIQEQKETLEKKIKVEEEAKKKLEEKQSTIDKKIFAVREELGKRGGVNAAKENHDAVSKQIRVLENRLDKGLQKFNEAVATNKQLRDQKGSRELGSALRSR